MQIQLSSAYKQLQPAERTFVDGLVRELENAAMRANERISLALNRPLPAHIVAADTRELLRRPLVQSAVTERVNEIAAETELTPHQWIKHAMACAFSSMANYIKVDEDGMASIDLSQCTPEQMMAIESLEVEGHTADGGFTRNAKQKVKIKLHSKSTFMQMLGKYMGMIEPDNPHWRADRTAATAPAIEHNDTVEKAGSKYQAMLEGSA